MKKCIICEEEASFAIKESKDYYCKECAEEQFGDISYLVTIEENKEAITKNADVEITEE